MPQKGIRDFCQIALEKNFTTPERVREVLADCIRAQKSGKEAPVGEIFLRREYLTRKQVLEIMKDLYGESAIVPENGGGVSEPGNASGSGSGPDHTGEGGGSGPRRRGPSDGGVPPPPDEVARGPGALNAARNLPAEIAAAAFEEAEAEHSTRHQHHRKKTSRRKSPDESVRVPWHLYVAVVIALVVGAIGARTLEAFLFDRPGPIPSGSAPAGGVEVLLASELEKGVRIEGTRWADADGKGGRVLLVHYSFTPQGERSGLPAQLVAYGIHDRAIIETARVGVEMDLARVLAIGEAVGKDRLFGSGGGSGVLRDHPSGILVVSFVYPALIERVILVPGQ